MAWIHQISIEQATGKLKKEFDAAIERAGRVWNIIRVMSINESVLTSSMKLYGSIMHKESPLSRFQREMRATVVSAELACPY